VDDGKNGSFAGTVGADGSGRATDAYKVGKGKPPLASRFQAGRSGNPSGRPKARINPTGVLLAELSATEPAVLNGTTRTISRQERIFRKLIDKALAGNMQATRRLVKYAIEFRLFPKHLPFVGGGTIEMPPAFFDASAADQARMLEEKEKEREEEHNASLYR
jgi:hypothetical protein